jgi:DASH complex subunit DAD1
VFLNNNLPQLHNLFASYKIIHLHTKVAHTMSTQAKTTSPQNPSDATNASQPDPSSSYFHEQRALLVNEIAAVRTSPLQPHVHNISPRLTSNKTQALDTTLTQLNRLNRNLESVTAVGNEFSSVEALWSQFEGVMGNLGQNGPGGRDGATREEGQDGATREEGQDGREDDEGDGVGADGEGTGNGGH